MSAEVEVGPGTGTEALQEVGAPIPLETRIAVQDFLIDEAHLLDSRQFQDWYALFTDDVEYVAPVRVMRKAGRPSVVDEIGHFDENKPSLGMRVRKLATDVNWSEDPPSLTRRFVTNVKVEWGDATGELKVRSYLLLFRSRHELGDNDLLSAERQDVLRHDASGFRIARRRILLDQVSLGTKNLAVFL